MAAISLTGLSKAFGAQPVLDAVSLQINQGEFVAVLGPSGCGKTTLLRLLAGFETLDSGEIRIGERQVAADGLHLPPEARELGVVFQNYALWPHMTVAENVGYSLKVNGVARAERELRTTQALTLVGLDRFADRRPADLSGGQRQRVALARCLVARPTLVLLDEPLANLDVHLRATMEEEFRRFHRHSGATLLYITHDQREAMALADRIVVLEHGRVMQFASPQTLWREPANEMVATFIDEGGCCRSATLSRSIRVRQPPRSAGCGFCCAARLTSARCHTAKPASTASVFTSPLRESGSLPPALSALSFAVATIRSTFDRLINRMSACR